MKEKIKIAKHKLRGRVVGNPQFQLFSRFGFFVRGVVYFLFGILGLKFSLGLRSAGAGFTDSIVFIQKQPFGQSLLIAVILGLVSYSLWNFLKAVLNTTQDKGKFNILLKVGYIGSAVSYAALASASWFFFRGFSIKEDSQVQTEFASKVFYFTFGRQLLILVGVIWALAGIGQAVIALKGKFKKNLEINQMGKTKQRIVVLMGKIGIISRGVIFFLIGILIIKAALIWDPSQVSGTEKVMEFIKTFTFGPILLAVLCGGLMIFGIFSVFQGIYLRFPSE